MVPLCTSCGQPEKVTEYVVIKMALEHQYHFIQWMLFMWQLTTSDFYSGQVMKIQKINLLKNWGWSISLMCSVMQYNMIIALHIFLLHTPESILNRLGHIYYSLHLCWFIQLHMNHLSERSTNIVSSLIISTLSFSPLSRFIF